MNEGIIGNGVAASQNPNIGWIGSLNSISNTGGLGYYESTWNFIISIPKFIWRK